MNLSKFNKVPYLFGFVCLALIALMAFQIYWLNLSKNLIEEQFDQKVNLAMGSALSDFYRSQKGPLLPQKKTCGPSKYLSFPTSSSNSFMPDEEALLKEHIAAYMTCYGIEEKYSVSIFNKKLTSFEGSYCCAIRRNIGCQNDYMLGISFASRDAYLSDKMQPMILSSILIFILLASVSFMILWTLVKQKRMTENNIDFFNNTAHELKTPLTNISLALKLLKSKYADLAQNKYAQIIQSENSKLTFQIERVLSLAQLENGQHGLKKEVLNVGQVLREVVDQMSLMAQEKGGQIDLKLAGEGPQIMGDYYHLSHVFRNLIDNALKYCEHEPQIEIELEEGEKFVKLKFKDNGIGISPKDQQHIFEKFQRVNTGNLREAKGFGIGLSYVKTIMDLHRGGVKVDSELEKGSMFQLLIPSV